MPEEPWWDAGSDELFDSPEAAALSGWSNTPASRPRVIRVEPTEDPDAVYVHLQLDVQPGGFEDLDIVTCVRTRDGKWFDAGSTSASSG